MGTTRAWCATFILAITNLGLRFLYISTSPHGNCGLMDFRLRLFTMESMDSIFYFFNDLLFQYFTSE